MRTRSLQETIHSKGKSSRGVAVTTPTTTEILYHRQQIRLSSRIVSLSLSLVLQEISLIISIRFINILIILLLS